MTDAEEILKKVQDLLDRCDWNSLQPLGVELCKIEDMIYNYFEKEKEDEPREY